MDALETIAAGAARRKRTIVLPEGGDARVQQAAAQVAERGLARVVLIAGADTAGADTVAGIETVDPQNNPRAESLAEILLQARAAKGMTRAEARAAIAEPLTLGACMVAAGDADGCVAGAAYKTADVVRAALQIVGAKDGGGGAVDSDTVADSTAAGPESAESPGNRRGLVSSFFLMQHDLPHQALRGPAVFADCALVIEPDAAQLARIACDTADSAARLLNLTPRVALLSFSTAGSARHRLVDKVRRAGELVAAQRPHIELLPEVQFDAAVMPDILRAKAPQLADNFGEHPPNVFIFPDLQSANIAYKIAERIGGARAVGPILQGLRRPVNDLSRGCGVDDIVNLVAVTAVQSAAD